MAKLVETQKNYHHCHNYSFFIRVIISFFIWWISRNSVFFVLWVVSNEKLFERNYKNKYKKNSAGRCLYFSQKIRKTSESRLFPGCCNGKTHMCDQMILDMNAPQSIWNSFSKKHVLIICVLSAIKVFQKTTLKKMIVRLWWPLGAPYALIFPAIYISCQKT